MRSRTPTSISSKALAQALGPTSGRLPHLVGALRTIASLDPALPIALLPVRLETRFFPKDPLGAARLCVRIYPDDIHVASENLSPMLPASWVAFAWGRNKPPHSDGSVMFTLTGASQPVREGLVVKPTNEQGRGPLDLGASDQTAWLIDYAEAEAAGMAITLPLTEATTHHAVDSLSQILIDQLVVVGARKGAAFHEVFDSLVREITDQGPNGDGTGRARLLRVGTPTNVVEGSAAGGAPPGGFVDGSGPGARGSKTDGELLADAVGVTRFESLGGGTRRDQAASAAVNTVLWPSTMLALRERIPELKSATADLGVLENLRKHFIDYVRAQGPFPTLEVDGQPYGILPVMAQRDGRDLPRTSDSQVAVYGLTALADAALPRWRSAAAKVPALDVDAADADDDLAQPADSLAKVLLRNAYPDRLFVEVLRERTSTSESAGAIGPEVQEALDRVRAAGLLLLQVPQWSIAFANLAAKAEGASVKALLDGLEDLNKLASSTAISPNPTVRERIKTLQDEVAASKNLLTGVRRNRLGLLGEVRGDDVVVPVTADLVELVPKDRKGPTLWSRPIGSNLRSQRVTKDALKLLANVLETNGSVPWTPEAADAGLLLYLLAPVAARSVSGPARNDTVLALKLLAEAHPEELNAWLAAGIDLFSTRLDAWITSLATRRLHEMRATQPKGLQLGAYGVVCGLAPREALVASAQLAPSVGHVITNSVLHAAHNTYSREGESASGTPSPHTVTLTSERVRLGQWLLDGVRQGQTLSDLLGEVFEVAMQDAGKADLIDDFRVATRGNIRRRVDGLLLARRWRGESDVGYLGDFKKQDRAKKLDDVRGKQPHKALENALDCVYDVGLYESAHAFSMGNISRGAALLSALDRGDVAPPGPEALASSTMGLTVRHRLLLSLPVPAPSDAQSTNGGWSKDGFATRASPIVDNFIRAMLPDPKSLTATVTWQDAEGHVVYGPETVSLEHWAALDLLRDAVSPDQLGGSAFARRLAARHAVTRWDELTSAGARRPMVTPSQNLSDALLLAQALRAALDGARAATPASFEVSEEGAVESKVDLNGALDATTDGLPTAPPPDAPGARWKRLVEMDKLGFAATTPPPELPTDDEDTSAADLEHLASVVLAHCRAISATSGSARSDAIASALGWRLPLVAKFVFEANPGLHTPSRPPDTAAIGTWLSQFARVRSSADRADRMLRMLDLVRPGLTPSITVLQHDAATATATADRPWLGDSAPTGAQGARDLLHIAVIGGVPTPPATSFAGLVIDSWSEQIPLGQQTLGVGLHWDAPTSRPPNAILLAVPPSGENWSAELLAESVLHTVDLARVRLVDSDELKAVQTEGERSVLPGVLLTNKTISTGTIAETDNGPNSVVVRVLGEVNRIRASGSN